jgi:DNA-binding LacI/PurR family transcriptional regulator
MRRREAEAVHIPVREYILRLIRAGELSDGDPIDTEESLTHKFRISRRSVRTAIQGLVEEGYLRKLQGKGTFITPSELRNGLNRKSVAALKILIVLDRCEKLGSITDYYQDFIGGIAYQASLKGHTLVYFSPDSDPSRIFKIYEQEGCSGIIWLRAIDEFRRIVKKLDRLKIPQVLINRNIEGISSVSTNEDFAFFEMVDFFAKTGHRHVAFLNFNNPETIYANRTAYFRKYAEQAGILNHISVLNTTIYDCEEVLRAVFHNPNPPTSLILGGHSILVKSLSWLSSCRIPEDLSVICYNDSSEAISFKVPLSVYDDPRCEIGQKAMELLELLIEGRVAKGECRLVKGKLIIRRSCSIPAYLQNMLISS